MAILHHPLVRIGRRAEALLTERLRSEGALAIVLHGTLGGRSIARIVDPDELPPDAELSEIGTVAGCPVLADADVKFCPHEALCLVVGALSDGRITALLARPESEAESQQRLLCEPLSATPTPHPEHAARFGSRQRSRERRAS